MKKIIRKIDESLRTRRRMDDWIVVPWGLLIFVPLLMWKKRERHINIAHQSQLIAIGKIFFITARRSRRRRGLQRYGSSGGGSWFICAVFLVRRGCGRGVRNYFDGRSGGWARRGGGNTSSRDGRYLNGLGCAKDLSGIDVAAGPINLRIVQVQHSGVQCVRRGDSGAGISSLDNIRGRAVLGGQDTKAVSLTWYQVSALGVDLSNVDGSKLVSRHVLFLRD
jgi:hypothetical protein